MDPQAILIDNGLIVTGDAAGRRIEPGGLLIEGNRIAWVGPMDEAPAAARHPRVEVIDAGRSIVMPGLVNAHMHSNECFEQGAYDNLPLELWLVNSYPPFGMPILSEREHYLRTMICAMESIRSGVTTVQDDLLHIAVTPEAVDGAAKAYCDAGLRAVITVAMWDRPFLDCVPYLREVVPAELAAELDADPPATAHAQVALFERHHRTWQNHAGRLKIIPAPSGPQRCSDDLLRAAADLSARYDLPVHTHVLESKTQAVTGQVFYGKTLVEHLDDVGMLTPRFTMNHAIWLTKHDIELLGDRKCSITHNPLSNMKLGSGVCPVRALQEAGVNVALGTDGTATSDTADMIEAFRAASLLHKIGSHDFEQWISADEAFRMATLGGARSTGLQEEIGSLEIGKRADVILLDRDAWGFIPLNDPIRQLAFSVTSECVTASIIDGRVVMRDRTMTLLDEAALKAEVAEAAERFRREYFPKMQAGARRVEPYLRQVYERCTGLKLELAHDPHRMPPRQN
jgi:5-methylthioadenosine/S-adenosylhomocysteine deaminase